MMSSYTILRKFKTHYRSSLLSLILSSDDKCVDLFHIIKTNETPIHPTKEEEEDGNMHIKYKRENRNSNGLSKREREREDTLASCVIRIAKLFSDYTEFA